MLLNIVYASILILLLPWLAFQAIRSGKYRNGWREKLFGDIDVSEHPASGDRIWLHAVSVGEVNLAVGLCRRIRELAPPDRDPRLFISTTTVTGYRLAVERFGAGQVFYCPFDFTWAIRRALSIVRPNLIVLIELEIWPNWVRIASDANIPVAVVNGRLSERSFRGYCRVRRLVAPRSRD